MKKPLQILLLISVVGASGVLLAHEDEEDEGGAANVLAPVANAAWNSECGSCHMAYHPGLLPARSWQKLMGGLDKHFGENASLDDAVRGEITRFLVEHSADRSAVRRSRKIAASIASGKTPLRISETPYFISKHDEVRAAVWKHEKIGSPANCGACHQGADKGDFSEDKVKIPR